MRYAIITLKQAKELGLNEQYYTLNKSGKDIIVNENDIANSNLYGADWEKEAQDMGIELISLSELKNIKNKGGWQ